MVEPYFVLYRVQNRVIEEVDFPINVMYSAFWFWKNGKFRGKPRFPKTMQKLFLDSGGYQAFTKFGSYPFTVEDYARYISEVSPNFAATMDFPCEPQLSLGTVEERIQKTVLNAKELAKLAENEELVMVLQGYRIDDYLSCINLYEKEDLSLDHVAIGSLCRRKSNKEIYGILNAIRKVLPNSKIHGFGLSLTAVKDFSIFQLIDSFDTQAWLWEIKSNRFKTLKPYERVLSLLREYNGKINFHLNNHSKTQTLIPYIEVRV
jgi:hypothetical protein